MADQKTGNLWEKLAVVNQGWQSEATDGPKGTYVSSFFFFFSLIL